MQSPTISARLDADTVERIERLAQVDRRTRSQIIAMLIERGLDDLESDILLRDQTTTYKTKTHETP